jgi:hypothetical protein
MRMRPTIWPKSSSPMQRRKVTLWSSKLSLRCRGRGVPAPPPDLRGRYAAGAPRVNAARFQVRCPVPIVRLLRFRRREKQSARGRRARPPSLCSGRGVEARAAWPWGCYPQARGRRFVATATGSRTVKRAERGNVAGIGISYRQAQPPRSTALLAAASIRQRAPRVPDQSALLGFVRCDGRRAG